MSHLEIKSLLEGHPSLELRLLKEKADLSRHLNSVDVNRPGLALAGFFKNFASERIQIFGRGECAYLNQDLEKELKAMSKEFFTYPIPAIVFTHGNVPPDFFIEAAEKKHTPLMSTPLSTHTFIVNFTHILSEVLAARTSIHGVLIDVFGVGILLMGASGIGKSETALELIERGHRLVADDVIQVICTEECELYGMSSEVIQHNMELRGLGIINIKDLFGIGAIRNRHPLELVIGLENWLPQKEYDRLGLEQEYMDILGVKIPRLLLPVRPGRNIPVLIETAAINHRSKKMGYHAARNLNERINQEIQSKSKLDPP